MRRAIPFIVGWIAAWLMWRFLQDNPYLLAWTRIVDVPHVLSLVLILCVFASGYFCLTVARRIVR